jgi:HK97 family phage major capsid protein
VGATLDEVKKAVEEINQAFVEHKKTNDARLEALSKGQSTAAFDEKLARIGPALDGAEKIQREWLKQQEEQKKRFEEWEKRMEAKLGRESAGFGGAGESEEDRKRKMERKAYNSYLRRDVVGCTDDERKTLTRANDTTGGYLAPAEFIADIIKGVVDVSPMRQIVSTRTIGTSELKQPKRTTTAKAKRIGETQARTETQNPAWGLISITAPEMYAEAYVSFQNLEDSVFDLEAELRGDFAEQFAALEGEEIVKGDGVQKCQGITDASAGLSYTASGSAATIAGASGAQGDGLVNLFHAVKTEYANNGRWVLNRASLGKVRLLKDTAGQYLWQPGTLAMKEPATILGAPYTEAPDMPSEGTNTFPIAFGDLKRGYRLVDRIEMSMVRDPFTKAGDGLCKFTARRRVGGQVILAEAIRLLKCATS